jgi:small subunit ribosomal protein S2
MFFTLKLGDKKNYKLILLQYNMTGLSYDEMLDAGVHFGHLRKKWNPKMLPYIFMERKGIHIIDLNKTNDSLVKAAAAMKKIVASGRKILFVATKKQAKEIVANAARETGMPFVTERWLGGMLTNFITIRKSIRKMQSLEQLLDEKSNALTKKERLMLGRDKAKLERVLGGIANLNRLPAALFIVDISHEHIALAEAKKLNLATFAMVDTNSDPTSVDFAIPANDDASKSVALITNYIVGVLKQGLAEYEENKSIEQEGGQEGGDGRKGSSRRRRGGNASGGRRRRGETKEEGATENVVAPTPTTNEAPAEQKTVAPVETVKPVATANEAPVENTTPPTGEE